MPRTSATRGLASTFRIRPQDSLVTGDYLTLAGCTAQQLVRRHADLQLDADAPRGSYVVTIANDRNFTNQVRNYVTAYTSLTPRESLLDNQAGQAYYWFVRPCRDASHTIAGRAPMTPRSATTRPRSRSTRSRSTGLAGQRRRRSTTRSPSAGRTT